MIIGAFTLMILCKFKSMNRLIILGEWKDDNPSANDILISNANMNLCRLKLNFCCLTSLSIQKTFQFLLAFNEVGGYERLVEDYFYAAASNVSEQYEECKYPPSYSMDLFRPRGSDIPWFGMVFGATVSGVWYWCTDQVSSSFNFKMTALVLSLSHKPNQFEFAEIKS